MTNEIAHLHVHTDASKIDGLGTVDRLVNAANKLGFRHLAMTDHGSLANTISFIQTCATYGIKPIIGLEGYVDIDKKVHHITLLADGNAGFNSLIKLNNAGQQSEHNRPAFLFDDLIKYSDNLLCLTGCPASVLQSATWPEARKIGLRLKEAFGPRLFAEAMFVSETPTWERSLQLSKDLKLPIVTTNDVHFAYPEDAKVHTILTQLKAAFSYESKLLYLATSEQIVERLRKRGTIEGIPIANAGMANSIRIADRIQQVSFSGIPTLPHIEDATAKLEAMVEAGLIKLTTNPDGSRDHSGYHELKARADYELSIIKEMDYVSYFLILEDQVNFARRNGVRVGSGRGSGVASVVLYAIGVTEINPLRYDLSFERFLNPKRKGMPDVDVDYDSAGRQLVIDYTMKRWGAHPVATYARYSHKTLVHELSKYFRLPRDLEANASDEGPESEAFKQLASKAPDFMPAYNAMMGQIKSVGTHAGGVIVTDQPVPLERSAGGRDNLVAAWTEGTHKELTSAGIVKYDVLGLSALSVLQELEAKFGFRAPQPRDGAPELELFRRGDLVGIFQFSGSPGIVEFTKRLAPTTFEDLVAINALYRPGALDSGTATHYPEWRKKPRQLHPLIDSILAPTYGVIVYQEQVMAVFSALTDGDLGSADLARRTISKSKLGDPSWELQMAELREIMMNGASEKDFPETIAELLWKEIATHARYSFNKAHSVAYADIAWQMAWWKWNHRADFYAAMLNNDGGEVQKYIFDIIMSGIEVVPPHVLISTDKYVVKSDKIYMPLSVVKHLGEAGVRAIMNNSPFDSTSDFMLKVPKKDVKSRARLGLWRLKAFEGLEGSLADLAVKDVEPPADEIGIQREYMGFIIPPSSMINDIEEARSLGFVAGIVIDKAEKESKFGPYTVYYLMPSGVAWSRNGPDLQIGKAFKLKTKANSGKILSASEL